MEQLRTGRPHRVVVVAGIPASSRRALDHQLSALDTADILGQVARDWTP